MGLENDSFWTEIGLGFGELGDTPPSRISMNTPSGVFNISIFYRNSPQELDITVRTDLFKNHRNS